MTDDRRAALELAHEAFHKANEAATNAANLALRMSLLMNGGAAMQSLVSGLALASQFLADQQKKYSNSYQRSRASGRMLSGAPFP